MNICVNKCDLCGIERRSDASEDRTTINSISLNLSHIYIQKVWKVDVCGNCAYKLQQDIENSIKSLKKDWDK